MSNFTNKAALKRHLLNRILVVNPGHGDQFTRVSAQALEDLEIKFLRVADDYLRAQRIGKTITTP